MGGGGGEEDREAGGDSDCDSGKLRVNKSIDSKWQKRNPKIEKIETFPFKLMATARASARFVSLTYPCPTRDLGGVRRPLEEEVVAVHGARPQVFDRF